MGPLRSLSMPKGEKSIFKAAVCKQSNLVLSVENYIKNPHQHQQPISGLGIKEKQNFT